MDEPRWTPTPHPSARILCSRAGSTLVELATSLVLIATLLGLAAPHLRGMVDRSAVVGAREALVGLVGEARVRAVAHGGALLRIRTRPPSAVLLAGGDSVGRLDLAADFGVELSLSRDRAETELVFDAMGLGRISSETVRLFRGGREARLIVSGYGRVRRP